MKWMLTIFIVMVIVCPVYSQTAVEIVKHAADLMNQPQATAKCVLTITTTSGDKRTFKYDSYSSESGKKNLIRYTYPGRVKGQAMLLLNNADDIWAYFPVTGRVRKLATHAKKQKMQGSDFAYEDMGSGDSWLSDYTAVLTGTDTVQNKECWKVDLKRKPDSSAGYSRCMLWVEKKNYCTLKIEYYHDDNPDILVKTLDAEDFKTVESVLTAMKMTMHNNLDGTDSVMELKDISYSHAIDPLMFTEKGLKK